jgi:ABC-type antimicrobial peptide transport system permease subunit
MLIGVVLGSVASFWLVRLLENLLHGMEQYDPIAFVGAAATIGGAAMLASYLPARRACDVDPLIALRAE